jgi:ankyrin repeat protein
MIAGAILIGLALSIAAGVTWAVLVTRRNTAARRAAETAARQLDVLYRAASRGALDRLWQELDQGASVNQQNATGDTALHFAYYYGQQDAIPR